MDQLGVVHRKLVAAVGLATTIIIMIVIIMAPPSSATTTHITNKLSSGVLRAHCASRKDDLGNHTLAFDEGFGWSFGETFGTLFWCDLESEGYGLHFDAYDGGNPYRFSERWEVRDDAVHGKQGSSGEELVLGVWLPI
ncbi:unnamed protein product [Linum tenue]|uniref:S-protein homolog n=1 Tax=Linum tenue TaxID=586396 RepID=A0AAV0NKA7_9ROSI|nr:unnamed protein product [Linum tenue]